VAEWALCGEVAWLVLGPVPAAFVFRAVVPATEWGQVARAGWSAESVFDDVVEVALDGWSVAAGLAAGAVRRLDESALGCGGFVASAGGLVVDDFAVDGDGAAVFESACCGVFDVVDHFRGDGAESGEVSCFVGEAEPGFEVGDEFDLRDQVFIALFGARPAVTGIVQVNRRASIGT
jgi:hypothetical protein